MAVVRLRSDGYARHVALGMPRVHPPRVSSSSPVLLDGFSTSDFSDVFIDTFGTVDNCTYVERERERERKKRRKK